MRQPLRPAGGSDERLVERDATWLGLAHPVSVSVFERHALDQHVRRTAAVAGDARGGGGPSGA